MKVYAVINEEGAIIKIFAKKRDAFEFRDRHNEDRHPNTMEYFVKTLTVRR